MIWVQSAALTPTKNTNHMMLVAALINVGALLINVGVCILKLIN
jgi:hypothetical protein